MFAIEFTRSKMERHVKISDARRARAFSAWKYTHKSKSTRTYTYKHQRTQKCGYTQRLSKRKENIMRASPLHLHLQKQNYMENKHTYAITYAHSLAYKHRNEH